MDEQRAEQIMRWFGCHYGCSCADIDFTDWPPDLPAKCGDCRSRDYVLSALTDAREEGKRAQTEGLLGTAAGANQQHPPSTPIDRESFRSGWRSGFAASGEGWNGEYPPPPDNELKRAEEYAFGRAVLDLLEAQNGASEHGMQSQANEKTGIEGTREAGAVRRETPQT